MIFRICFTVRFRHSGLNSSQGNLLTYVWAYCKQAGSAFIDDDHLLPHLTIPAGVVYRRWTLVISRFMSALQDLRPNCRHRQCTVDGLAAILTFSHHSCRLLKRFQFAVGQGYAAMCAVLAMLMLLYRLSTNVKLKVLSLN